MEGTVCKIPASLSFTMSEFTDFLSTLEALYKSAPPVAQNRRARALHTNRSRANHSQLAHGAAWYSEIPCFGKDSQKQRRTHWAYKAIDDLYKSLKRDAEHDAQAPIDEHYRDVLDVLGVIASSESSCTCRLRDWYGKGHDTQCPIRIATEAHPSLDVHRLLAKAGAA
jgi:hypothetical protein